MNPYEEPQLPPEAFIRPREGERSIYTEKRIDGELLAVWERSPLPDDANVTHVTMIPYRGEKAVVPWRNGQGRLPEGDVKPGESAEQAIKRILEEQAGILEPTIRHLGHFRCKPSSFAKEQEPGAISFQALYGVEVGSLADFPGDRSYERRVIQQRDLNVILRTSYVQFRREYTDSLDPWLIERLKAQRT